MIGFGYQNNLADLFVFFLVSTAGTGMIMTNQNMSRVKMKVRPPDTCFANEDNSFIVSLSNQTKTASYQVEISGQNIKSAKQDIPARATVLNYATWKPTKRGLEQMPRMTLASTFPFSMLRAWKVESEKLQVVVFPQRLGMKQFPKSAGMQDELADVGLFRELRELRPFDSPRRVHWPSSLRNQKLLVRSFEDTQKFSAQYLFNWEMTAHLPNTESRLSQLALWVDLAEQQGCSYGLKVGNFVSAVSSGQNHCQECLRYLALFNEKELLAG